MLLNCSAYQDGRKTAELSCLAEIQEYAPQSQHFLWVTLRDPSEEELAAIKARFDLHELAVEDALQGGQRPKVEQYENSLFVALHTVAIGEDGELITGEIDISVGESYVLSVLHGPADELADVRARCDKEPELLKRGAVFVMYALADAVVDRYAPVVETVSAEIEDLEDRVFGKNSVPQARAIIQDLYSLRRRLVQLRRHIAPLHAAIGNLLGGPGLPVCEGMQAYFRDIFDHLERSVRAIDARQEMVITAIQVNIGMIDLTENEISKRVASFAALFAVPTMIAGIYGMNFQNMPELHFHYGYPLCLAAMLSIDACLFVWFRRAGWL
ncbi:magnesium/cobalt transporter CorA [Paraburkholderia caledonica]